MCFSAVFARHLAHISGSEGAAVHQRSCLHWSNQLKTILSCFTTKASTVYVAESWPLGGRGDGGSHRKTIKVNYSPQLWPLHQWIEEGYCLQPMQPFTHWEWPKSMVDVTRRVVFSAQWGEESPQWGLASRILCHIDTLSRFLTGLCHIHAYWPSQNHSSGDDHRHNEKELATLCNVLPLIVFIIDDWMNQIQHKLLLLSPKSSFSVFICWSNAALK